MKHIEVSYGVYSTPWTIRQALKKLSSAPILAFDTETRGLYTPAERKQAEKFLDTSDIPVDILKVASLIASSSGLSFPSLVHVTHFIFGISETESLICIAQHPHEEVAIWNWIAEFPGLLAVHNSLFDLKLMYHRVKALPRNFEDTALMAKVLTNDADVWKSKVGLKDLMGHIYDPKWALYSNYEPEDLKDPAFLDYAAIDGAATYRLYHEITGGSHA